MTNNTKPSDALDISTRGAPPLVRRVELPDNLRIKIESTRHLTAAGKAAVTNGVLVVGDVKKFEPK